MLAGSGGGGAGSSFVAVTAANVHRTTGATPGPGSVTATYTAGDTSCLGAVAVVARGRELAARALEAAASDIEYDAGHYRIAGTDRSVSLFALAANEPGGKITLSATATAAGQTWPNGCQAAEVEVDPHTGAVRLTRMVAVDDIGTRTDARRRGARRRPGVT